MYQSLVLVDPDVTITAEQLAEELRRFYAGRVGRPADISLSGEEVTLRWPEYELTVGRSAMPHVREESADIAEQFGAGHVARERVAQYACRFEVSGEDDPDMDHFNDYLYVGEALERLGRVYRFRRNRGTSSADQPLAEWRTTGVGSDATGRPSPSGEVLVYFEGRELRSHGDFVKSADLVDGHVYFRVAFVDDESAIPELIPLVFVGRDRDPGDPGLYFQDVPSYLAGERYEPGAWQPVEGPEPPSQALADACSAFHVFEEREYSCVCEYEGALDQLLACFLKRGGWDGIARPITPRTLHR